MLPISRHWRGGRGVRYVLALPHHSALLSTFLPSSPENGDMTGRPLLYARSDISSEMVEVGMPMFTLNDLIIVFLVGIIIGALLTRGSRPPGGYYR
jgi:hypothetical protein